MNAAELRRRLGDLEERVAAGRSTPGDPAEMAHRLASMKGGPADAAALAPFVAEDLRREIFLRALGFRRWRREDRGQRFLWDAIDLAGSIAAYEDAREIPVQEIERLTWDWHFEPERWRQENQHNPEAGFKFRYRSWVRGALVSHAVHGDASCTQIRDAADVYEGMSVRMQCDVFLGLLRPPTDLLAGIRDAVRPPVFTEINAARQRILLACGWTPLDNGGHHGVPG